jgi:hypothetical protein
VKTCRLTCLSFGVCVATWMYVRHSVCASPHGCMCVATWMYVPAHGCMCVATWVYAPAHDTMDACGLRTRGTCVHHQCCETSKARLRISRLPVLYSTAHGMKQHARWLGCCCCCCCCLHYHTTRLPCVYTPCMTPYHCPRTAEQHPDQCLHSTQHTTHSTPQLCECLSMCVEELGRMCSLPGMPAQTAA